MDWRDDPLWQALAAMQIEPEGAALTFTRRLAGENGWTLETAEAVFAEYRRFLYLSQRAGHPVTPPDAVDQAWHLHLSYSRHYWDALCGVVLGRPLHHAPTMGGAVESHRHWHQYAQTLESYQRVFHEAPPPAIWPEPSRRNGAGHIRADLDRMLVIPKARMRGVGTIAASSVMLTSCVNVDVTGWPSGLVTFGLGAAVVLALSRVLPGKGGTSCSTGCSSGDSGCGGD